MEQSDNIPQDDHRIKDQINPCFKKKNNLRERIKNIYISIFFKLKNDLVRCNKPISQIVIRPMKAWMPPQFSCLFSHGFYTTGKKSQCVYSTEKRQWARPKAVLNVSDQ